MTVRTRGFTLIEMVLAIMIIGIIAALGGLMLNRTFDSYTTVRDTAGLGWPGRVALERMAREIRAIRSQTAADIPTWSTSTLEFYDTSGNRARYYQAGTQLARSDDGGATYQPMANGISNLTFAYTDKNDQVVTPAAGNEGSVYYISVTFIATVNGAQETYRVSIKPRMFQ